MPEEPILCWAWVKKVVILSENSRQLLVTPTNVVSSKEVPKLKVFSYGMLVRKNQSKFINNAFVYSG